MSQTVFGKLMSKADLPSLIQKEQFVGWVFGIEYDSALVMTNDLWKANVNGIPQNCFLIATTIDPDNFSAAPAAERELILLRVVGSSRLPQDDDLVRTKIDHFQEQKERFDNTAGYDDLTQNQIQFGGLECRVLGTFYVHDNKLWLGSDIETFSLASRLRVFRPVKAALEKIVNHIDPIRLSSLKADAIEMGLKDVPEPIRIGTVRYTSTDRLHRKLSPENNVAVYLHPGDFLARRTAVFGMTRTGKSNMVKHTVAMVKRAADASKLRIGQLIFDINGEYANANAQDKGAISEVFPAETVRYRGVSTEGFRDLRHNFYLNYDIGLSLLQSLLKDDQTSPSQDLQTFINASLEEPDPSDRSSHNRWQVRLALFRCILSKAGFVAPPKTTITFPGGQSVRQQISQSTGTTLPDPKGLTISQACEWFQAARQADVALRKNNSFLKSSSGKEWFDSEALGLANVLAKKNQHDTPIYGYSALHKYRDYHSPSRQGELLDEIYTFLEEGKIVILDLSVGNPIVRDAMAEKIAKSVFDKSLSKFVSNKTPSHIVLYIEEAHNLIGKKHELTDTWPRLAKEGAKYRLALVYATQEPSSVHPNIMANTENWIVTHLNNDGELRELSKFYDFADFQATLKRAQDVGFARVKTLSGPFVIPVQIDKFDAEKLKAEAL